MKLKKVISMLLAAALVTGLSVGGVSAANAPEEPAVKEQAAEEPAAQSVETVSEPEPEPEPAAKEAEPQKSVKETLLEKLTEKLQEQLTSGEVTQSQIEAALNEASEDKLQDLEKLLADDASPVTKLLEWLGAAPPEENTAIDAFPEPDTPVEPVTAPVKPVTTPAEPVTAPAPADGTPDAPAVEPAPDIPPVVEPTPTPPPVAEPAPTPTPVVEPAPTPTPVVEPAPTPTPVVAPTPTPPPVAEPAPTLPPAMDSFPGADEPGADELTQGVPGEELPPDGASVADMFTPLELERIRLCLGGDVSVAEILETAAMLSQEGLSRDDILNFFLSQRQVQTFAADSGRPVDPTPGDVIKVTVTPNNESASPPMIQINPYQMRINSSSESLITEPIIITSKTDAKVEVTATASVRTKGGVTVVGQPTRGAGAAATNARNIFLFMEYQYPYNGGGWTPSTMYTDLSETRVRIPEPGQNQSQPIKFTMEKGSEAAPTRAAVKIGGDCSIPISLTTWKESSEGYYEGTNWMPGTEEDGVEVTVIFSFASDPEEPEANYNVVFKFHDYWGLAESYGDLGTITTTDANGQTVDITNGTTCAIGQTLNFHCELKQSKDRDARDRTIASVFMYCDGKDAYLDGDPSGNKVADSMWDVEEEVEGRVCLYNTVGDGAMSGSGDFSIPPWVVQPSSPNGTAVVVIQVGR